MPLNIVVCAKQVVDPETPSSAFEIDNESRSVLPAQGIPPVVNGFDENAVEAAIRIKEETNDANVVILSIGTNFVMDVMKKPLSMGADQLVLIEDEMLGNLDGYATAYVLVEAIKKLGEFDLVLCGRQASDWDNAQVPMGVAEMLDLPCVTVAQKIEIVDSGLVIQRVIDDGYQLVESPLPALVTLSNELGEPRYPTLRGIMTASRKAPLIWTATDLNLDLSKLVPKLEILDLSIPVVEKQCEFVEGEDDEDTGRKLALKLRESKLI